MIRIDLHCHTKKTKIGDGNRREITPEKFVQIMKDNEVKLAAITNHNCFDSLQYNEIVDLSKNDLLVLPGVELDVIGCDDERGHLILICDPNEKENLNKFILSEKISNYDKYNISIEHVIEKTQDFNCFYIFHYIKKPCLSQKTINYFAERVGKKYRIFNEPSNLKSLGILISKGMRGIIGSDVKDWDYYDSKKLPLLKFDIENFESLMFLAKKDEVIVNQYLNKKQAKEIEIILQKSEKGKKEEKTKIELYNDVNIIFGAKGSGKSIYAKAIADEYEKLGKKVTFFNSDDVDKDIKELTNTIKEIRDFCKFLPEKEDDIDFDIFTKIDEDPPTSFFVGYYKHYESLSLHKNQQLFKIIEMKSIMDFNDTSLKDAKNILETIDTFISYYKSLDEKYKLNDDDNEKFILLTSKLLKHNVNILEVEWKEYIITNLTNHLIDKLRKHSGKLSNSVEKPKSTGLYKYWIKRRDIYLNALKFDRFMNLDPIEYDEINTTIDLGKELTLVTKAAFIDKDTVKGDLNCKIRNLKKIREYILSLPKYIFDNNKLVSVMSNIEKQLNEEEKIKSLNNFISIKKIFKSKSSNNYIPSAGEKNMLVLQSKFNEKSEVFVFDEPDKSLGNLYVNDNILPKINELAQQSKIVVIATHSGNLAVRTLPYLSIYKEYNLGTFLTYKGNMYTNKLCCTDNKFQNLDWKKESIKILEGGEEAFMERGESYGIEKN